MEAQNRRVNLVYYEYPNRHNRIDMVNIMNFPNPIALIRHISMLVFADLSRGVLEIPQNTVQYVRALLPDPNNAGQNVPTYSWVNYNPNDRPVEVPEAEFVELRIGWSNHINGQVTLNPLPPLQVEADQWELFQQNVRTIVGWPQKVRMGGNHNPDDVHFHVRLTQRH